MVTTGFSKPYVAKYANNSGTVTYTSCMVLGRGVNVTLDVESADDNNFYADNVIAETETSQFVSGSATITVDGLTNDAASLILGLPATEELKVSESVTVNLQKYDKTVQAPYVGFGYVRRTMMNGVTKYWPVVHPKVKFSLPSDSAATQEDTIDWQTQELTATVLRDDTTAANWKTTTDEGLDTEDEAVAVIQKLLGETVQTQKAAPTKAVSN